MQNKQGGCLCGNVRYEIRSEPRYVVNCHCVDCRRASGATSLAWSIVPREAFRWTAGEPRSFKSSPPVTRTFCGECGTTLTYAHDKSENIDVTTATLDDPEACAPVREIWVDERIPWVVLDDRLPHFARGSIGNQPINQA